MTDFQAPMTNSSNSSFFSLQPSALITQSIKVPSGRRYLLNARRGLTLVEVLIALTASLVLLGAVVSVLGMVSGSISDSRSIIESAGRLRSAQNLLRSDLAGATCNGLVWQKPEDNAGYIEIVEGRAVDLPSGSPPYSLVGDIDDMLFMTVRSNGAPFSGTTPSGPVKSNIAEVVWFLAPPAFQTDPGITTYNLHRRMFLIMPNGIPVALMPGANTTDTAHASATIQTVDISYRLKDGTKMPCTLGDLTNRANRVFHNTTNFPYVINTVASSMRFLAGDNREGEDIVLSNVVGFDIKVFDPRAKVDANGLIPGDPNYNPPVGTNVQRGAYVNLGFGGTPADGNFTSIIPAIGSNLPGEKSKLAGMTYGQTFDTWSTIYEFDGIGSDQGYNGLDDDGNGIVDDADERETSPPYPYPLRGIQIKIRIYEPNSGTVREVTVEESFMNR